MRRVLAAAPTLLRFSILGMLQYRAEIMLWALWGIVSPAVLMAVWSAAAAASNTPGHIGARTGGQMLAYFFMTMIVGHLTTAWDLYEMGWQVRTGRLSPLLLRPIWPIWSSLADNTAYKLVTLAVVAPIWVVLALVIRPQFDTTPRDALAGAVALLLASLLNFVWGYVYATLAFFLTKMDAVSEVYFGVGMLLGGRLAPIDVLPRILGYAADLLPFRWIFFFPSQVLAGQATPEAIVRGLLWQVAWLIAGVVIFRIAWSRGVRRYSAVGA